LAVLLGRILVDRGRFCASSPELGEAPDVYHQEAAIREMDDVAYRHVRVGKTQVVDQLVGFAFWRPPTHQVENLVWISL
jgi:hypothetical protein